MIVDHGEWPIDLPDPAPSGGTVVWLFGSGLSIGCGLVWNEPNGSKAPSRAERIEKIIQALRGEMDSPNVDPGRIREFLISLNEHTAQEWRHLFVTTNWDYLLQRELSKMVHTLALPSWLHLGAGSHVYHLNGTV